MKGNALTFRFRGLSRAGAFTLIGIVIFVGLMWYGFTHRNSPVPIDTSATAVLLGDPLCEPGLTPKLTNPVVLLENYADASGAVYHPQLDKIFFVSNSLNTVSVMDPDGGNIHHWTLCSSRDLEAITVADPVSRYLYIGQEYRGGTSDAPKIIEFDYESLIAGSNDGCSDDPIQREFDLILPGISSNKGLEGVAFLPRDGMPDSGGLFLAGSQADGKIYEFEIPIRTKIGNAIFSSVGVIDVGFEEIAGLEYDFHTKKLYALSDADDEIALVDSGSGRRIGELIEIPSDFTGNGTEGLAVRGCEAYIAEDDTGRILKFRFSAN